MKIDFDGVQAFVAVAELGGFGKAAAFLNLTQTALSRRVQKLEAYLGARLLDRTTRVVALTAVGRSFLPQAQRIVGDLTLALTELRDTARSRRGGLVLGCIPTMAQHWLPQFIRRYAAKYPGNRIRILDLSAMDVSAAVLAGQAEFGITILLSPHADLVERPILEEPFVLFVRRDHPLGAAKSVAWSDLRSEDLIMVSSASGNRVMLDYQLARHRIDFRGAYEVNHSATALGLVDAGVGMAILPSSTIQEGTHPNVCQVPIVRPTVTRTITLVWRKNASLSPPAEAFYRMLLHEATGARPAGKGPAVRRSRRADPR